MKPKNIAIVHEYLNQLGGAERVLVTLAEMYPHAPIYVLFVRQETVRQLPEHIQKRIHTSWLQKLPVWVLQSRMLFPFYPVAIEQFDLRSFDLVISSSSAYAKNILTGPETHHLCYCHSPMRYVWDAFHGYRKEQGLGKFLQFCTATLLSKIRMWDYFGANRVDTFIANSQHVQARIKKYYGRSSVVIYPPCTIPTLDDIKNLPPKKEYFLIVARLSPYKNIESAVRVCTKLNLPLKVVGTGRSEKDVKAIAGPTIEFLGRVSDEMLKQLYQEAKAFLFPSEEDFGMTMVEALGWGTPVIALNKGGAQEIITNNNEGILYDDPTDEGLAQAIAQMQTMNFSPIRLHKRSELFSIQTFKESIYHVVDSISNS